MTAKNIMFQGTASTVGKSVIAAAFCRIFKQDGYRVAPFKTQNMALNSYVTGEGGEISRAQVVQAEAAGVAPAIDMNPVLIKPTSDCQAQVIVGGRVYRNMSAMEYELFKPALMDGILASYARLAAGSDIIVIEGAGSPAEINLRERDLVNMGIATRVDAPVIVIGDIDKGGVFASFYGTAMLLEESERSRIRGFIINKFRGDPEILAPGLRMIEERTGIPVLGVVPYFDLSIDDEDSITERFHRTTPATATEAGALAIGVIRLPYMANYTDFAPLENQPGVELAYFQTAREGYRPDLVIIPGSKNTAGDLQFIRENGLQEWLAGYHASGGLIMGVCGGFQMLGQRLLDPGLVESGRAESEGLGLLNVSTTLFREKVTTRVRASVLDLDGTVLEMLAGAPLEGYEIHMGVTTPTGEVRPFTRITERMGRPADLPDGCASPDGRVCGTYIHGLFDTPEFLGRLLQLLLNRKTDQGTPVEAIDYKRFKEQQYDQLAGIVRNSVDLGRVYETIFKGG